MRPGIGFNLVPRSPLNSVQIPANANGSSSTHQGSQAFLRAPALPPTCQPTSEPDRLEAAADEAIVGCGGNVRDAVKALIVANEFLESEVCFAPTSGHR